MSFSKAGGAVVARIYGFLNLKIANLHKSPKYFFLLHVCRIMKQKLKDE